MPPLQAIEQINVVTNQALIISFLNLIDGHTPIGFLIGALIIFIYFHSLTYQFILTCCCVAI
jgi:hypothetical protein